MEKNVKCVEEFVAVRKIAGINADGLVTVELVDGTEIGVALGPGRYMSLVVPDDVRAAKAVYENDSGALKGFEIVR
ncbi:MAG: hypothetical protein IJZ39_11640 [Oscillospiraceae bacterium]|nr:hypothetical protein [Oscillospiraceae bacterium]